jgi:hypothetical protein
MRENTEAVKRAIDMTGKQVPRQKAQKWIKHPGS